MRASVLVVLALLLACNQPGPSDARESPAEQAEPQPMAPAPDPEQQPPTPSPEPSAPTPILEVARHDVTGATLEREREREQLAALLATPCPTLKLLPEDDYLSAGLSKGDNGFSLEVWSHDDHLVMAWSSLDGIGMYDFAVSHRFEIHDARACTARLITSSWRGRLVTQHGSTRPLDRYPPDHTLASLLGEWADCDDPRHGFACMFLGVQQRCPDIDAQPAAGRDWDLVPITKNPSPWVDGPRADQVETFWPEAEFWARTGQPIPARDDDEYAPSGIAIGRSLTRPRPAQLARKVGRYRLYQALLPVKTTGFALLMRDDMKERHRWIGHTRDCLLAEDVEWLIAGEHLIVGWAYHDGTGPLPDGLNGLFVVDLESGVIHLLRTAELAAKWDGEGSFWWRPELEPEPDGESESGDHDGHRARRSTAAEHGQGGRAGWLDRSLRRTTGARRGARPRSAVHLGRPARRSTALCDAPRAPGEVLDPLRDGRGARARGAA